MRGVVGARQGARGSRKRKPAATAIAEAGEHLVRAAIYYHFAKFVFVQDPLQMRAAHMKAVECYRDGVAHARPPGERVECRIENRTFTAC